MTFLALKELTNKLDIWTEHKRNEVFIIDGPSQIGKTTFIKNYAKYRYFRYIYIDVKANSEMIERLLNDAYITPENFYSSLCFHFNCSMSSKLTHLIFDGIEHCPLLRQFFKTLVNYDQVNIIAITCGGLGSSHYKNLLVPSEENINRLFPMTFNEFMKAIDQEALETHLSNAILNRKPISEFLSNEIFKIYKLYNLIGGFPSVVEHYIKTKDIISCISKNMVILIEQLHHAQDLLNNNDKEIMKDITSNIFSIVANGTYSSLKNTSLFKMKQLLSFLEDEYVITMPTALDVTEISKPSNSKRLYFFHQCFYHAANPLFKNDEYFANAYPIMSEVLTDFFFNQRYNSKMYRFGIYRLGKYVETDALLSNNMELYDVEFKAKRLSIDFNKSFSEKTNRIIKPGILLFNGNVFEFGDVTVLPSYCSCYLNEYVDNIGHEFNNEIDFKNY